MANFGFEDLVVVEPHEPVWQETRSAVGAEEITPLLLVVRSFSLAAKVLAGSVSKHTVINTRFVSTNLLLTIEGKMTRTERAHSSQSAHC